MISKMLSAGVMGMCMFGLASASSALAGDIERGERISSSCIACHGPGGNSHIPAMYPSLAGQEAETLASMLEQYRSGEIQDPQMTPQAANLTDEDIADLAAYFAAQEPK